MKIEAKSEPSSTSTGRKPRHNVKHLSEEHQELHQRIFAPHVKIVVASLPKEWIRPGKEPNIWEKPSTTEIQRLWRIHVDANATVSANDPVEQIVSKQFIMEMFNELT